MFELITPPDDSKHCVICGSANVTLFFRYPWESYSYTGCECIAPNQADTESEEHSGDDQEGDLYWHCEHCNNEYADSEREAITEEMEELNEPYESDKPEDSPKFKIIS